MRRRELVVGCAYALLGGATITLSACVTSGPPPEGDAVGSVSENHGHVALITAARLVGVGDLTLDIRGAADHTHTIELLAIEVLAIRAGQRTLKRSTSGAGHAHTVTFN
jgi:hypothetical protein